MTGHVRGHHRRYGAGGRIWQGSFKAFPIQADGHLLRVLRYVERNPVRANLVTSAREWRWSSLSWRGDGRDPRMLSSWPVERPVDWLQVVDMPETAAELAALRRTVRRGVPYGEKAWVRAVSGPLGLESAMRGKGRTLTRECRNGIVPVA